MVKAFRKEQEVFLKGLIMWCKHLRPDMTFPPGKWSTNLVIEGEELDKFRSWQKMGIRNTLKETDDGFVVTLSRKVSFISKGGKVVGLEPPFVFRMEGDHKVPINTNVGNGSTGIAKCALWDFNPEPHIRGKALRWEALRVDNLVEYKMEKDFPGGEGDASRQVRGIDEQEALF